MKILDDNTGVLLLDMGVNGTSVNNKDIVISLTNDPDTLEAYNFDRYKFQTEMYFPELPTNCYTFDKESYTIPAGEFKTTASVHIDLNQIENIYENYVLPIKISSSTGELIGPGKYSKLLANIKFTNQIQWNILRQWQNDNRSNRAKHSYRCRHIVCHITKFLLHVCRKCNFRNRSGNL